jgi:signal transduction histidine kinase
MDSAARPPASPAHPLSRWGLARRYAFAVVAVLLVLLLRWSLQPFLGYQAPMLAFVLAALLAAWYGGLGPGLVATGLSLLAGVYFFIRPTGSFWAEGPENIARLLLFAFIGVAISLLNGRLRSAEREVRALAGDLERRVEERTAQLEDANRALEAFSYSVSHDLRAPLRGMQGFSQALLEDYGDRLDETGQDYARRILAAAGRMEVLIEDLLTYGRLSRVEIDPQQVALSPALREAQAQIEEAIARRGARIRVDEPLPAVRAHRPTLVQVLANLLSNAVKFVPEDRVPEVRVWAENGGGRIFLYVEDNGIGVAPEHQSRIFDVFERLHGRETYPGTGIGLAIVRRGVERMGGHAGVASEPGRGSRFWIDLPVVTEES